MSFRIETADIFSVKGDILIHQANCQCTMGSGIAKTLRDKWPEVYDMDCKKTIKGDRTKLGKVLPVSIADPKGTNYKWVLNCYSQFLYGHGERHTDYEAYYTCLTKVRDFAAKHGPLTVVAPYKMGCSLAGGDWNVCEAMFKSVFGLTPVPLIVAKHPDPAISDKTAKQN